MGGFNIGGINASGQIPAFAGNYGLIDRDTPHSAYTRSSYTDPSAELQLVFSDEFNVEGRTFYPGNDPYWEAADLHYWAVKKNFPHSETSADYFLLIRRTIWNGMIPRQSPQKAAHLRSHSRMSKHMDWIIKVVSCPPGTNFASQADSLKRPLCYRVPITSSGFGLLSGQWEIWVGII